MKKSEFYQKIIELRDKNLTNREISKNLGVSYHKVNYALGKLGLTGKGCTRRKPEVSDDLIKCTDCGLWKLNKKYAYEYKKGFKYQYRHTYCNDCGNKKRNEWLNKNIDKFLRRRYSSTKYRCLKTGIEFGVTFEYLLQLYELQKGKCAYSNKPMSAKVGDGRKPEGVSLDRFDNSKGYIPGNVVFCHTRMNAIKNDLSLEEIKYWLPKVYKRGKRLLESLDF